MRSVRFYSVSERRRYDPSRSVTGSSTDEVRRSLYPAHGREADTRTGSGNDFGVSVRTVRRWEDRYEADGAEGLYDHRLGKLANTVERHSGMCMPFNTGNRPLRGGDDERYPGPNRYGYGDAGFVRHRIPGLFARAFPREACHPPRVHPELQLGTPHITEPWPGSARASTRSPSAQTAPPSDGRHDAAPGWLHASMDP